VRTRRSHRGAARPGGGAGAPPGWPPWCPVPGGGGRATGGMGHGRCERPGRHTRWNGPADDPSGHRRAGGTRAGHGPGAELTAGAVTLRAGSCRNAPERTAFTARNGEPGLPASGCGPVHGGHRTARGRCSAGVPAGAGGRKHSTLDTARITPGPRPTGPGRASGGRIATPFGTVRPGRDGRGRDPERGSGWCPESGHGTGRKEPARAGRRGRPPGHGPSAPYANAMRRPWPTGRGRVHGTESGPSGACGPPWSGPPCSPARPPALWLSGYAVPPAGSAGGCPGGFAAARPVGAVHRGPTEAKPGPSPRASGGPLPPSGTPVPQARRRAPHRARRRSGRRSRPRPAKPAPAPPGRRRRPGAPGARERRRPGAGPMVSADAWQAGAARPAA
jgi:hypothetical protein